MLVPTADIAIGIHAGTYIFLIVIEKEESLDPSGLIPSEL
jgi:hypothetical protein